MSEMGNVNGIGGSTLALETGNLRLRPASHEGAFAQDRVEISDAGAALATEAASAASGGYERLAVIRGEIEAGTYESDHRVAVTVDRLLYSLR